MIVLFGLEHHLAPKDILELSNHLIYLFFDLYFHLLQKRKEVEFQLLMALFYHLDN